MDPVGFGMESVSEISLQVVQGVGPFRGQRNSETGFSSEVLSRVAADFSAS
jgi:hypothetical protein